MSETDLPLEPLIAALRKHAAVSAQEEAEPLEVIRVISQVRTAALEYVEAVFDTSGWSNVFEDLYEEDAEPDLLEDEEDPVAVDDGIERLTVTGRWDVVVRDEAALRTEVLRRLQNFDGDAVGLSEHTDDVVELLGTLLAVSGPVDAPGLEDAGASWSVGHIARTLDELDEDERDDAEDDL